MPFHTPPSAEVAGYAGFALFEALSDLLIIKDVLTRNEVDELLARTASRLQTSPDKVGRSTADFVRQLIRRTMTYARRYSLSPSQLAWTACGTGSDRCALPPAEDCPRRVPGRSR